MINGQRVLGIIPARGGSKGVPRKNVRPLGGKPLLQWTVEAARASKYIDRLILSTDDDEIAELGRSLGVDVPFRRSPETATDEATAHQVIAEALGHLGAGFGMFVWLQPTSPFRVTEDIDGSLERVAEGSADACVSVTETGTKAEWLFFVGEGDRLTNVLGERPPDRRQQLRQAYALNGAVYAADIETYRRTGTFFTDRTSAWVMPADRSLDLDEPADFERAEAMIKREAETQI